MRLSGVSSPPAQAPAEKSLQQKGKPFERTSALEIVATTTISAKVNAFTMRLSGVATPPAHAQFERTGHCKYGDQCRFTHDVQPAKEPAPQKRAQEVPAKDPKYAGRTGNCRYGDQCKGERFHHAVSGVATPPGHNRRANPSSALAHWKLSRRRRSVQR